MKSIYLLIVAGLLSIFFASNVFAQGNQTEWKILNDEAVRYFQAEQYDKAINVAREALSVAEANGGQEDPSLAITLGTLADCYTAQGNYVRAESLYKRALEIMKKHFASDAPEVTSITKQLALIRETQKKDTKPTLKKPSEARSIVKLPWKYKDWELRQVAGDVLNYSTPGKGIPGYALGFLEKIGSCDHRVLFLVWSTGQKEVTLLRKEPLLVKLTIDGTDYHLKAKLKESSYSPSGIGSMVFLTLDYDEKLIALLKQGRDLRVTIFPPEQVIDKFDSLTESFSLNGFTATMLKSREFCERGEGSQGMEELERAAEQGGADEQLILGTLYDNGLGVTKNYQKALKWYQKSAEQGQADAQFSLGKMYEEGHGVKQNYTEAIMWYRKAAEQDSADAQFSLGIMYVNGLGVTKDERKAEELIRKAAEKGHANAQHFLWFTKLRRSEKSQVFMESPRESIE